MTLPLLSIVTANLDSPVLGDVIGAVLEQAAELAAPVEIIVAGRDGPGVMRRFSREDGVTFVETPHAVWPARARNIAIARARGDLIASLDADCVPEPGWLAALHAAHRRCPERCVAGGSLRIDAAGDPAFADNLASFHAYLPTRPPSLRRYLPACNFSVRREAFDEVGPFDETLELSEDLDWMFRARRDGYALRFCPEVRAWHRSQRASAEAVVDKAERAGHDSIVVRRRYGDRLGRLLGHPEALAAVSPILALGATGLAFLRARGAWRRPRAAPIVFAAKLAWCRGAARRLRDGKGPGRLANPAAAKPGRSTDAAA